MAAEWDRKRRKNRRHRRRDGILQRPPRPEELSRRPYGRRLDDGFGRKHRPPPDEFGFLPPGDLRRCLVALSSDTGLLRALFEYRFNKGLGLNGHSFGNLFLTVLRDLTGSDAAAIREAAKILNVQGQVLPVTLTNCQLGVDPRKRPDDRRRNQHQRPEIRSPSPDQVAVHRSPGPDLQGSGGGHPRRPIRSSSARATSIPASCPTSSSPASSPPSGNPRPTSSTSATS